MLRALAMTSCDLSACAKPWKIQYETVKVIFKEFYAQVGIGEGRGRGALPFTTHRFFTYLNLGVTQCKASPNVKYRRAFLPGSY